MINHKSSKKSKLFSVILSPVIFILIWYITAFFVNAVLILPFPHQVVVRLIALVQTKSFWLSFGVTVLRVFISFLISFVLGFVLGILSADYGLVNKLLVFPLNVIRATPLVAFILLALFWFKSGTVPVFVAVLMSLPVMLTASQNGFEKNQENQEKLFKAESRGFKGISAFVYIRLPGAMPSVLSGAESAFGLCWKVVAAGEVLSIPQLAAGSLMQRAQVHLETVDVFAITAALVMVSVVCQWGLKFVSDKFSSKKHEKAL